MATDAHTEIAPLRAGSARLPWRLLVSGGALVVLGSIATNTLSFLFSFIVARMLRPEEYATVTACLSLLVVIAVPATTLQLVTARYAAMWLDEPVRARALVRLLSIAGLVMGVVCGLALIVASPAVAHYLRLSNPLPLIIVAFILSLGFVGPVYRGWFQGLHAFGRFALVSTSEFAVRFFLAVGAMAFGLRVAGALGGVLGGAVAAAALGWYLTRQLGPAKHHPSIPILDVLRWGLPALLVQTALNSLLFTDTLLAKHLFSPADAGAYAGLATTARVLVYASGALATFLFPIVARLHRDRDRGRVVSHLTMGLLSAVEVALVLLYAAAPSLILRLIVGMQYAAVSPELAPLAIALSAYALVNVLVSYLLAAGNRVFLLPLFLAPIAQVLLMLRFHASISQFVHIMDAVMLTTLLTMLAAYLWPSSGRGCALEEEL